MKRKVKIRTEKEIRYPTLLSGALESMGYLVDRSPMGRRPAVVQRIMDLTSKSKTAGDRRFEESILRDGSSLDGPRRSRYNRSVNCLGLPGEGSIGGIYV